VGHDGRVTMPPETLPSAALDSETWAAAHDELVGLLRDLIRIPSINPPDPPGAETEARPHLALGEWRLTCDPAHLGDVI